MTNETLILGAVAYDPKVVTIWDGFTRYFEKHGLAFDYVLYSNYERQVEGHFAGQFHVAWNSIGNFRSRLDPLSRFCSKICFSRSVASRHRRQLSPAHVSKT